MTLARPPTEPPVEGKHVGDRNFWKKPRGQSQRANNQPVLNVVGREHKVRPSGHSAALLATFHKADDETGITVITNSNGDDWCRSRLCARPQTRAVAKQHATRLACLATDYRMFDRCICSLSLVSERLCAPTRIARVGGADCLRICGV